MAGRVDHRGEEASLLADAVWIWEEAAARGPAAIAQEVANGERGRSASRWGGASAGNGNGNGGTGRGGNGNGSGRGGSGSGEYARVAPAEAGSLEPSAPGSGSPAASPAPASATPAAAVMRVSPLRGGGVSTGPAVTPAPAAGTASVGTATGAVAPTTTAPPWPAPALQRAPSRPSEPLASVPGPEDLAALAPERDEAPLPDEARAVAARASAEPTAPLEAPVSGILNVSFTRGAETARMVLAMEELRAVLKERPGATRVVFHLPGPGGATLPMEVRGGVAYDTELLAEVRRRLGEGLVRLELSTQGPR